MLVPTASFDAFAVMPFPKQVPPRDGGSADEWQRFLAAKTTSGAEAARVFTPEVIELDRDNGAIPAAVLALPQRIRGHHPLFSFAAVGPKAPELILAQQPLHVHTPFRALVAAAGYVVLMGVGLTGMTLIHQRGT